MAQQKWKYFVEDYDSSSGVLQDTNRLGLEQSLSRLGEKGWELVTSAPISEDAFMLIFKGPAD